MHAAEIRVVAGAQVLRRLPLDAVLRRGRAPRAVAELAGVERRAVGERVGDPCPLIAGRLTSRDRVVDREGGLLALGRVEVTELKRLALPDGRRPLRARPTAA